MGIIIADYLHLQKVKHDYLRSRTFKETVMNPCWMSYFSHVMYYRLLQHTLPLIKTTAETEYMQLLTSL